MVFTSNVTSFPAHTVMLATVTVGIALTTTVVVAVAVQPLIVPITP